MSALLVSLGAELSRVQHRLGVGIQLLDQLTGRALLAPLRVRLLGIGTQRRELDLQPKGNGRYSLADSGEFARLWNATTAPRTLDLLVHEARPGQPQAPEAELPHAHGPRRVQALLLEADERPAPRRENLLQLALMPGPAYPFLGGATLLRGRVQRQTADGPQAARWARLVAFKNGRLLGSSQADERGDYALLLRYPPGLLAPATPSASDGEIELRVAARGTPPPHRLPFDDIEPEQLAGLDAPDPWAALPAAYGLRVTLPRTLSLGQSHSGPAFDFVL